MSKARYLSIACAYLWRARTLASSTGTSAASCRADATRSLAAQCMTAPGRARLPHFQLQPKDRHIHKGASQYSRLDLAQGVCTHRVLYTDLGMPRGMRDALTYCQHSGLACELRKLGVDLVVEINAAPLSAHAFVESILGGEYKHLVCEQGNIACCMSLTLLRHSCRVDVVRSALAAS